MCLQSLESAAHRSHVLKKKSVREGVTSNLAAATEKLLQDLQSSGVIGEFELDSACLSYLAKLPSHQQMQVRCHQGIHAVPAIAIEHRKLGSMFRHSFL